MQDVTFNGNGYSFKGNGDLYWDGEGTGKNARMHANYDTHSSKQQVAVLPSLTPSSSSRATAHSPTSSSRTLPRMLFRLARYAACVETILNLPNHTSQSGGSAVFSDVLVDNLDGDTNDLGHNTDGFDGALVFSALQLLHNLRNCTVVSADDVTIKDSTGYNQDDCLAFNSVFGSVALVV